jgi:hypothetical protein
MQEIQLELIEHDENSSKRTELKNILIDTVPFV